MPLNAAETDIAMTFVLGEVSAWGVFNSFSLILSKLFSQSSMSGKLQSPSATICCMESPSCVANCSGSSMSFTYLVSCKFSDFLVCLLCPAVLWLLKQNTRSDVIAVHHEQIAFPRRGCG